MFLLSYLFFCRLFLYNVSEVTFILLIVNVHFIFTELIVLIVLIFICILSVDIGYHRKKNSNLMIYEEIQKTVINWSQFHIKLFKEKRMQTWIFLHSQENFL